jgi:integrase
MKLTTQSVKILAVPAGKSEGIFFDDDVPGFGVRVRDGGSRTYVFQYKLGAKQRRIAMGPVTALDIGKARNKAKDLYAAVRLGQDPAGEKSALRARAAETFEAVAALFLAYQRDPNGGGLRPRSSLILERHLLGYAKALHGQQLAKIDRRDIATCIAAISQNSGKVTSNRVRSSISGFFAWAIRNGIAETNPVAGTRPADEATRERVLEPHELRSIWNALGDDHYSSIVKLLMLSGARAGEIADLRWDELKATEIVLPGERTKNGKQFALPLSSAAIEILSRQPRRSGADGKLRDRIFGNSAGPFSGWSKSKGMLDERIAEQAGKPIDHWVIHDLRRSFATHAAEELKIPPHIIECCLNHISGFRSGVAGTYNRASYQAEMRTAMDRWADQLLAWVEGRESNVTPLRA